MWLCLTWIIFVCVLSALPQPINYRKSRDKLSYGELVLAAEFIDNAFILLLYHAVLRYMREQINEI